MLLPKIVYGTTTLNFSYPPVQKPGCDSYQAEREDTFSTCGIKQSITSRVDRLLTLQMDWVPRADLAAWQSFMDYAISGKSFTYYPDATLSTHTDYTLEDKEFSPAFVTRGGGGFFKFKLAMRRLVAA